MHLVMQVSVVYFHTTLYKTMNQVYCPIVEKGIQKE